VSAFFDGHGVNVVDVSDVEKPSDRPATHEVPEAILRLAAAARASGDVECDTVRLGKRDRPTSERALLAPPVADA
jgi:hypothetical protein